MNIQKLFNMQRDLDRHIQQTHQLEQTDLVEKKTLALLVELGELANETRCFKFWSLKGPSSQDVILEEYVDGIHFILSLGIEMKYEEKLKNELPIFGGEQDLTSQFLRIYEAVNIFNVKQSFEAYKILFSQYLHLGSLLGYTAEEIEKAYISKNDVNYSRQKEGY